MKSSKTDRWSKKKNRAREQYRENGGKKEIQSRTEEKNTDGEHDRGRERGKRDSQLDRWI